MKFRRSAGPSTGSDTAGIVINGRSIVDQTPGASIFIFYLSPMPGTACLGSYTPRLAAEADLWQQFRFTKLKIFYLPCEQPQNRNQCSVVGFTNVNLNAGPTSAAEILGLPSSHVFCLGGAGTSYNTVSTGTRQSWSIPKKALRPALVPWLTTNTTVAATTSQGNVWGYFNYTASTGPNAWMYVEWEIEFRNPVPAGTTLVLSRAAPSYRDQLVEALRQLDLQEEEEAKIETESHQSAVVVPRAESRSSSVLRLASSTKASDLREALRREAPR